MKRFIPFIKSDPRVAVIRLNGVIASGGRGLNDATLAPIVEKAFRSKPDAVALVINSPGGSPVQSSLIGARIRRLAVEKDIPVYAFVEDVAASGGYWLAAAADEIIVDASSVIGSIGVISSGFGLQDFIAKHGVERRVYTAGTSKSQLDPFKAENPDDIERLKVLLKQIHATFKEHVQSRRGDKLADADLFNGEIWVGHKGVEMGLADHVGHLVPFMKEKFGDKVQFRVLSPSRRSLLSRLSMGIVSDAVSTVEERAAYAQFGL